MIEKGYSVENGTIVFPAGTIVEYLEPRPNGLLVLTNHGVIALDPHDMAILRPMPMPHRFYHRGSCPPSTIPWPPKEQDDDGE